MKKLKIGEKVFAVLLAVALLSLLFVALASIAGLDNISDYSTTALTQLGDKASRDSEQVLTTQAEAFMVKIAHEQAGKLDAIISDVQSEVVAMSAYLTNLYEHPDRFSGSIPPLIAETTGGTKSAKYMLAAGTDNTPAIQNELSLLSNAQYMLAPTYDNNSHYSSIYFGTETGIFYRYSVSNEYNPAYDPRKREWYQKALQTPEAPVWIDVYIDPYGKTCVTNAKAFAGAEGKTSGVLGVDMSLEAIQQDIISMKVGVTGFAFLLDNDGDIIAHPYYDDSFNTKSIQEATGDFGEIFDTLMDKNSGFVNVDIDGKRHFLSFTALPTTGWKLCLAVQADEVTESTQITKTHIDGYISDSHNHLRGTLTGMLKRYGIILLLCTGFILSASYFLSNTITKPIKTLVDKVKQIGEGDLDTHVAVDGKDEIAELAAAFNKMTIDLKRHVRDLAHATAERERIDSDLNIARRIQSGLLPNIFPPFPGREEFDIYATMSPAREVGGDFYDFFFIDETRLCLVMADVAGKGIPAALFMVNAKTTIKNNVLAGHGLEECIAIVNRQLCENNDENMFVTAFVGIYETVSGDFTFVNAGHNPPLIKKGDASFDWLAGEVDLVLAALDGVTYRQNTLTLAPGDTLYLYTDGVTEAVNPAKKLYGNDLLLSQINEQQDSSLREMLDAVRASVDVFADGAEQADDITMLGFRVCKRN